MNRGIASLFLLLALWPAGPFCGPLFGQSRDKVAVVNPRLGLPPGSHTANSQRGMFKAGQWAPVYVDLECNAEIDEALILNAEISDPDETLTEASIEIGTMAKGDRITAQEFGRLLYLKAGSSYASNFHIRVKGAKSGRTYGEHSSRTNSFNMTGMEGPGYLITSLGANLPGLAFPDDTGAEIRGRALRGGWVETANLNAVGLMPDQWIGYGAVDLLVICTGSDRKFWETLAAPQHAKRRAALAEWVRRGGKVLIGLGQNIDVVDSIREIKDILPVNAPPGEKRQLKNLTLNWVGANREGRGENLVFPDRDMSCAKFAQRADRLSTVLQVSSETKEPFAVQGAYGFGKVTVLAYDVDRDPLSTLEENQRKNFWETFANHAGVRLPPTNEKIAQFSDSYDENTNSLQGNLDYFEGIPVVSFTWVALFILLYIILIGPVDYLFLKKVVKRLEWTWVTFPVIVIAVSVGAYYAAYAIKGRDLKTNKIDVVDIDLVSKRVDVQSWFTLFSPRIYNYTVSTEPSSVFAAGTPQDNAAATVVTWQGRAKRYSNTSGGILGSKKYRYETGVDPANPNRDLFASSMIDVPIQVWSTKAFSAQSSAMLDPKAMPVVAELATVNNNDALIGSITSNLPFDQFTDIALFWRGKVYPISDLPAGIAKPVNLSLSASPKEARVWLNDYAERYKGVTQPNLNVPNPNQRPGEFGTTSNPNFRIWPILFHELAESTTTNRVPNASQRRLDQSWRASFDHPESAILVLRLPTVQGPAESISSGKNSPSGLWLGKSPASGEARPSLTGELKQETYIRVFLPVKAGK
jgi:hypothetical protein